jgi:hypothetical protein
LAHRLLSNRLVVLDDRNPVVLRSVLGVAELKKQIGFRTPRARRPENALKSVAARVDQEADFASAAAGACRRAPNRMIAF